MTEQRKAERRIANRRIADRRRVANPKIKSTRQDILDAAKNFRWGGQLPTWTTVVEGLELPARPLVLKAARISDKDPVRTEEAVVFLSNLGFEVRCKGTITASENLP